MTDRRPESSPDINGDLRVGAHTWASILHGYEELEHRHGWDSHPMTELVRTIASSRLAHGLYAVTSHAVLVVGQTERFSFSNGALRIEFDLTSQIFHLEYHSYGRGVSDPKPPLATPERVEPGTTWERWCQASEGMAVLEHFLIDEMKWFAR